MSLHGFNAIKRYNSIWLKILTRPNQYSPGDKSTARARLCSPYERLSAKRLMQKTDICLVRQRGSTLQLQPGWSLLARIAFD
jgi:hypothetical protein